MNKPEVLAPAGGWPQLEAAVRAGADAVYLGAQRFSARAAAQNFSCQDLDRAVRYCHARGVRVHLAVNTLLRDAELPAALELIARACEMPVDAVLVQDWGLFALLRRACPGLPLHASTQMSVHGPAGARACQAAGFARVVLARELSLREIADIHAACPQLELEAFVHGALCMSVSGQCYLSAMLGGRSGNRGQCAQPCRLPFAATGGTGHDLSLKDLSMIPRLQELVAAGVCSCKIEGRRKRPEYVAAACHACRLAADGQALPQDLLADLQAAFSRSGFTTGYPDARRGREMFGVRRDEDARAAAPAQSRLHALYRRESQRVPVDFRLALALGAPATLQASDGEGHLAQAQAAAPTPGAFSAQRCREQLAKCGGTPFFAREITLSCAEGLRVPLPVLNALRREALQKLLLLRERRSPIPFSPPAREPSGAYTAPSRLALRARFPDADVPQAARACQWVQVPFNLPLAQLQRLRAQGMAVLLELPRALFGAQEWARGLLRERAAAGFTQVWAGTLDALALAREAACTVHGGFSLNIFNSPALAAYADMGLVDAELSLELTLAQARSLRGALPRGLLAYGRLPLMLTRCCPLANAAGPAGSCQHCRSPQSLTDRKGLHFPVQCTGSDRQAACGSELLNSVPLSLLGQLKQLKGSFDFTVLRFTTEDAATRAQVLQAAFADEPLQGAYTRGLYARGVE